MFIQLCAHYTRNKMSQLEVGDTTKRKLIYSTPSHFIKHNAKHKQFLLYLHLCHF